METDIHDYDAKIATEIKLIKELCSKKNQKLIFDHDLRYSIKLGLSKARRTILLNKLKIIANKINKPLNKVTSKDIEDFELKLIKEGKSKRTQKDYRDIIKQYYRWLDNEEGQRWQWIQKNFKNHKVPLKTYKPEDFMNEEERQLFLQAAKTVLEKAVASIFLSSGCRVGEIGNMNIGAVEFSTEDDNCIITVTGKTGERRIKLYNPTSGYLKNLLKENPYRSDPDKPFWLGNQGKRISYNGLKKILKRIGTRAGIKKPLNPHSFRHMLYTLHQLRGTPQAIREKIFGHVHGSNMAKIYTHASDQEVFNVLDEMHGTPNMVRKNRNIRLEVQMKQCSKCLKTHLPDKSFCDECGISLEKSVLEEQERYKAKAEMADRIVKLENSNERIEKNLAIVTKALLEKEKQKVKVT